MENSQYPTESRQAEQYVLGLALQDPKNFQEFLKLPSSAFVFYGNLCESLRTFWSEFNAVPTSAAFQSWCPNPEALKELAQILSKTIPEGAEIGLFAQILGDAGLGRGLLEIAAYVADFTGHEPHRKLLTSVQHRITDLSLKSSHKANTTRAWYWETAPDRWKRYRFLQDHPESLCGIKFGIPSLDKSTGGLHAFVGEADLIAIFGKPGVYKSRMMLNMAYNQARRGIPILYISREMSAQRIGLLLDALESLLTDAQGGSERLDYIWLQEGNLQGRYRRRYKNLLKTLHDQRQYPLWLVDCPDVITTGDVAVEVELYHGQYGDFPKVIYLDYANLIDPLSAYDHESQKMDRIFLELLGITKGYGIPLVTAVRESRTGSLIKDHGDMGIEHVGLSQAIAYHVHQLWHLDFSKEDAAQNRLWVRAKKNRYGELFEIPLFAAPEYAYVGDRELDVQDGYEGQFG